MSRPRPTPLLAALALAAVLLPVAAGHAAHSRVSTPTVPTPTVQAPTVQAQAAGVPLQLTVSRATVVAVPPGATETSGFLTLRNTGRAPVVLTGARTALARQTLLMTTRRDSRGRTGMSAVKRLTVPPGGTLTLEPSGDHLMLLDLTRPLKVGETVRLTMTAQDGRTLAVNAVVRRP